MNSIIQVVLISLSERNIINRKMSTFDPSSMTDNGIISGDIEFHHRYLDISFRIRRYELISISIYIYVFFVLLGGTATPTLSLVSCSGASDQAGSSGAGTMDSNQMRVCIMQSYLHIIEYISIHKL